MNEQTERIKYFNYLRRSSEAEDRQVLSIDSQRAENDRVIAADKLEVVDTLAESHSAKTPRGRPLFQDMLRRIEKGEANGIFIWNPNRLSRNPVDTGEAIYLMDRNKLLEVRTPSQIFRNTPNDKFLLGLFCNQAKLENDTKGEDSKRGLRRKAEMGYLPAGAKPGYMNDPYAPKGNKTIKEDPERFPIVKEAWRLMLTGNYSPPRILETINNKLGYTTPRRGKMGGKPMARSQIYTMFKDPFYHGLYEFPKKSGNWFRGKHKPMITEEEFWKVQELLGRKGTPRPQKREFAFTGAMRCGECGAAITAELKVKRLKTRDIYYVYYHCTKRKNPNCAQRVIEEKELIAQIAAKLGEIDIPPEFHRFAVKWLEKRSEGRAENDNNLLSKVEKDLKECKATIDGLIGMRARGELSAEDYNRRYAEANKEKSRLEGIREGIGRQSEDWREKVKEAFEFSEHAVEKFEKGDKETKRGILLKLGSNLTLKDKKLNVDVDNSLLPMKPISLEVKRINEEVRTNKSSITISDLEDYYYKSTKLLRW